MLNMIDTQDKLKNFSEQQLIREMQQPSGSAPQFMVLGEIERRKRMRADAQRQEGLMQPTVAQEAVSAAGVPQQGIAQVAQSLAPKTDMTQNTGVPNAQATRLPAQPNQPQRMAGGGVLRLAPGGGLSGGTISAIANLKIKSPDTYEEYKDDPEALAMVAEYFQNVADTPEKTGLESLEAPREYDLMKRMFADPTRSQIIDQQKKDAKAFGEDYALDQRARSLIAQRQAALDGNDMLFAEGQLKGRPAEYLTGSVSAGRGASAVPMPAPDMPFTSGVASLAAPELSADPVISTPSMDVNPRAIDDASDFSSDPRRGAARRPVVPGMPDAAPDVSGLTDEQARRLYLSGRDYEESDVPAIVDMLNREREFQQGDQFTPPEQVYDLSPRGQLKYEEAGDDEFTSVSNKLAREAATDAVAKEDAFFAAEDARFDAQRRADQVLDRRIRADQPVPLDSDARLANSLARTAQAGTTFVTESVPEYIEEVMYARGFGDRAARRRANEAEDTLMAMPVTADPNKSEAQKAAEAAALADKVAGTDKPAGGTKGTRKKSGIEAAKSKMDQDKWLALAQAGLTLMSTGDFGKAGSAGLAALRESGKADREERKLDAELLLREAQLAAANRKDTSGIALTADQLLNRGNDLIKTGQAMLENAGDDADAAAEARTLIMAGQMLIRRVTGGVASSGSTGAIKLPSAE